MRTLIIVMLIGVFDLCYFEMTFADITIDGETVHVETAAYIVQFDRGAISQLHNKLTGETYTLPLGNRNPEFRMQAGILGRNKYFWARYATTIKIEKINSQQAEILFRDGGSEIKVVIAIDFNNGDLLISGEGASDTPGVFGMQLGIENLDISNLNLILPSDGGQIINASSTSQYKNFSYPSAHWEAQLAIIEAERGGFYIRGTDDTFQFKELAYRSDSDSFGLGFQTHNQAPWDTLTSAESVTWRLNTYIGDYRVPARIYRDWMESVFNPWRLTNMPAWVDDIGLVIIYELDKGLAVELDVLSELVDPTKTLIYMVDWRKEGHDVNHPDYTNPIDGFGAFIEVAHGHGFRVMPHVNIYNVSPSHPLYPELKRFQYRRPWTGELSGWRWDEIDSPKRNAHISLASSQFRNLLVQQFKALWEKYNIDAFHLDVSHYVLNDANGLIEELTSAQGNVLMHLELAEAMPGVVFSGEGLHEVTFFRESFAQRWRLPQGVIPHPISAFLFSPYTHIYGDLGVPHPDRESSRYNAYLDSYESWGVLPTIRLWREGQLW